MVGWGLVLTAAGARLVLGALKAFEMGASLVALVMGDTVFPLAAIGNRDLAGGGVGEREADWIVGATTADCRAVSGGAAAGTGGLISAGGMADLNSAAEVEALPPAGAGDGSCCVKPVVGRSGVPRRGPNICARVGLSIAVAFAAVIDGETTFGEASAAKAALERAWAGLPGGGGVER